jgi:hypothetical protein
MVSKVNVKAVFVATNLDGTPYFSSIQEWPNVDYEAFVQMEKIAVGALNEMTKLGDVQVAAMKGAQKG